MMTSPYLGQLARQLRDARGKKDLTLFCGHCRAELPLFITDELAGDPVDERYPKITLHLDLCPDCLREYVELSKLITAALYDEELA